MHDCDHPYCPEYGDYTERVGDQVFHVCWAHLHWAQTQTPQEIP